MYMKNLRTLFVLAAAFCVGAQAQTRFGAAVELGPSIMSMKVESPFGSTSSSESGFGWNAGVFADFTAGKLVVQPSVLFGMKSAKEGDASSTMTGLDIPIMVGYQIGIGSFKLRPELGPAFGLGLSWKEKYGDYKSDNLYDEDEYKRFTFGLKFGAMFEINEHIALGVHFNKGLSNAFKYEESGDVPDYDDWDDWDDDWGYNKSSKSSIEEKGKWNFFSIRAAYTF